MQLDETGESQPDVQLDEDDAEGVLLTRRKKSRRVLEDSDEEAETNLPEQTDQSSQKDKERVSEDEVSESMPSTLPRRRVVEKQSSSESESEMEVSRTTENPSQGDESDSEKEKAVSELSDADDDEKETLESTWSTNQSHKEKPINTKKSKPVSRQAAQQAMELIRSESQRLTRESRLNLNYHTPKPCSLSDFLQRRKFSTSLGNCPKLRGAHLVNACELFEEKVKEAEKTFLSSDSDEELDVKSTQKEGHDTNVTKQQTNPKPQKNGATSVEYTEATKTIELVSNSEPVPKEEESTFMELSTEQCEDEAAKVRTKNEEKIISNNNDTLIQKSTKEESSSMQNMKEDVAFDDKSNESITEIVQEDEKQETIADEEKKDVMVEERTIALDVELNKNNEMEIERQEDGKDSSHQEVEMNETKVKEKKRLSYFRQKALELARVSVPRLSKSCEILELDQEKGEIDEEEGIRDLVSRLVTNSKPKAAEGEKEVQLNVVRKEALDGGDVELKTEVVKIMVPGKVKQVIGRQKDAVPGSAMQTLRHQLRAKIQQKREEALQTRILARNEDEENIQDGEGLQEDEEEEEEDLTETEEESDIEADDEEEEEEIEMLDDMQKKPRKRCLFLDDEAEEEDDESAPDDDEDPNDGNDGPASGNCKDISKNNDDLEEDSLKLRLEDTEELIPRHNTDPHSELLALCSGQFPDSGQVSIPPSYDSIPSSSLSLPLTFDSFSLPQATAEKTLVEDPQGLSQLLKAPTLGALKMRIVSSDEEDEMKAEVSSAPIRRPRLLTLSDEEDSEKDNFVKTENNTLNLKVESDSDTTDDENDMTRPKKKSEWPFVVPDSEESSEDEFNEKALLLNEEEEEEEAFRKNPSKMIAQFVESEAELSGSEEGSADEILGQSGDEYEDEVLDEQDEKQLKRLGEEGLRDQIERTHRKLELDADKREVMLLQDMLLEDGDLHTDGPGRERKFRWRNLNDLPDTSGPMHSSDEETGADADDADDAKWRLVRFEREKFLQDVTSPTKLVGGTSSADSGVLLSLGQQALKKPRQQQQQQRQQVQPQQSSCLPGSKKGSFLSRKKEDLERLGVVGGKTKEPLGGAEKEGARASAKGSFLFTTISPSEARGKQKRKKQDDEAPAAAKRWRPHKFSLPAKDSIFQFL